MSPFQNNDTDAIGKYLHSISLSTMRHLSQSIQRILGRVNYLRQSYATHAAPLPASKLGRGRKVVSLDHFLQRQRVIALWRSIVRATNKINNAQTKREMRGFARDEFERYRDVEDLEHIRYLISTGSEQLKSMTRYVNQMQEF